MTDEECTVGKAVQFKGKNGIIASSGFQFDGATMYYIKRQKGNEFIGCATAADLTAIGEAKKQNGK